MNRRGFFRGLFCAAVASTVLRNFVPMPAPLTQRQLIERMIECLNRLPKNPSYFISVSAFESRYAEMLNAQHMVYGVGPGEDALRKVGLCRWERRQRRLRCT